MSRLANIPIQIPQSIQVQVTDHVVQINKGNLSQSWKVHESVKIQHEDNELKLSISETDQKNAFIRSMLGTDYRHILNYITGMDKPFETVLEIHGLGYRVKLQGKNIVLSLGKSHDDIVEVAEDIEVDVPNEREIKCRSYCKKKLGDFVALIASKRKPDPYKAKGVRIRGRIYRTKKD